MFLWYYLYYLCKLFNNELLYSLTKGTVMYNKPILQVLANKFFISLILSLCLYGSTVAISFQLPSGIGVGGGLPSTKDK